MSPFCHTSVEGAASEPGWRMDDPQNLIHDAAQTKPDPYKAFRIYFPDGSRQGGIWTGKVWWSEDRAVYPEHWQQLPAAEPDR